MNDEPVAAKTESPSRLALIALCFALAIAVIGLAYTATVKQPSIRVITGNLSVSYMPETIKVSGTNGVVQANFAFLRPYFFATAQH